MTSQMHNEKRYDKNILVKVYFVIVISMKYFRFLKIDFVLKDKEI